MYQEISKDEYIDGCMVFLRSEYKDEVKQMVLDPDVQCHFGLSICAQILIDRNPILAQILFAYPNEILPHFDQALLQYQRQLQVDLAKDDAGAVKEHCHVRVQYLPRTDTMVKATISRIRSTDVGKMIQVSGTIIRTGMIKMLEASRTYMCENANCQTVFKVQSDLSQGNVLELPKRCPTTTNGNMKCKSTQFRQVEPESNSQCCDYQEIKIQEQVEKLTVGSIPRSIVVILQHELVDTVKAGDDVTIVGILFRRWKPCMVGGKCQLETILYANSTRCRNEHLSKTGVTEEMIHEFEQFREEHGATTTQRLLGRNRIIQSICPQLYGLFMVKLATLLTVIGGCSHVDENGMRTRGEPHMLLIGDPGTGKSQFLRFTAELVPRSVLTTGIGTTSAGLTCTAVKDSGEWMLEAGALVLADRGVCCIDEFSGIRNNDRTSIHEAMEQQTLSVAKAGLVCKLNARTTVFAVTNPKGKYDINQDVSVNTAIGSPLLSRFDLIMILLDTANVEWDQMVSTFVLQKAIDQDEEDEEKVQEKKNCGWSIEKLRGYVAWVKDQYHPTLSEEAKVILQQYYQLQRASDTRTSARTTIRLLESLVRVTQAHARLMMNTEADVRDAVMAVCLVELSCATTSTLDLDSALHSKFPSDPLVDYLEKERRILKKLNLSHLSTTTVETTEDSSQVHPVISSSSFSQKENNVTPLPSVVLSSHKDIIDDAPADHLSSGGQWNWSDMVQSSQRKRKHDHVVAQPPWSLTQSSSQCSQADDYFS